MALKNLTIVEKQDGSPLEMAVVTRRLGVPTIIQPTYTFNPSDMYGYFVPEVSFNDADFYWNTSHYLSVSTGFANGVYVRESSLGPDFRWINGLLDVSITTTEASVGLLWTWNINQDTSIGILNNWNVSQDGSIVILRNNISDVSSRVYDNEVSIGILNNWNINQDTSILVLNNWNINQDISIAILNQWNINQDISISWLDGARRLDMLRDVSIVDVSHNNVLEYDACIGFWKNAEPEEIDDYFYDKIWIDASCIFTSSPMEASTATEIRFDKTIGRIYGTTDNPLSASLTISYTNAIIGAVNLIIHKNNASSVSLPGTFKRLSGGYDGSVNNFIYVQYLDSSNQVYTISQVQT